MLTSRRHLMGATMCLSALASAQVASAQTPPPDVTPDQPHNKVDNWPTPSETIDLWPQSALVKPLHPLIEHVEETELGHTGHFRRVQAISTPRMSVFPAANPDGSAVLIIPGGGYYWNYFDHEGYLLAKYLNERGISAFVLFYRLPSEGWAQRSDVPLADGQRAMRLIRAQAKRLNLDPERVSVLGFSAGGHLCGSLLTRYDAKTYAPLDQADTLSARPHLGAPIYPVLSMQSDITHLSSRESLLGPNPASDLIKTYSAELNVTKDTPACFMVHAEDDTTVPIDNTLRFRSALKSAGIACETHLFASGGHGFGMRSGTGASYEIWPELLVRFLKNQR